MANATALADRDAPGGLTDCGRGGHRAGVAEIGGDDAGPELDALLLMALGSCTSIAPPFYAPRKRRSATSVIAALRHERRHAEVCGSCSDQMAGIESIAQTSTLIGALDESRTPVQAIADRCRLHRTLTSLIAMHPALAPGAS